MNDPQHEAPKATDEEIIAGSPDEESDEESSEEEDVEEDEEGESDR